MKLIGKSLIVIVILALSLPLQAQIITIPDAYIGSDDHGYGDVIGDKSKYDIIEAQVNTSGPNIVLDIYTRYLNNIGSHGTALGDLFISTNGWNPFGSPGYLDDDHTNGEGWEFGFALNDYNANSGNLYVFSGSPLTHNGLPGYLTSDDVFGQYTYRNGQEVRVNRSGPNVVGGTWILNLNGTTTDLDDFIRFVLPKSNFGGATDFGFHWAMTCGNDTIEGGFVVVPEPSTVMLLGLGLLGMGFYSRKPKNRC